MIRTRWLVGLVSCLSFGCGAMQQRSDPTSMAAPGTPAAPTVDVATDRPLLPDRPSPPDRTSATLRIGQLIDGWHAAAARADEESYFAMLTEDAVFLGTDATERWSAEAFRAYAHPHFAKGKAWSFRSVRRSVTLSADGRVGWFEEELETPNLGPARGTGVVVERDGHWRIAQYSLAVTVPNDRFDDVKRLLDGQLLARDKCEPPPKSPPCPARSSPRKRPGSRERDIVIDPWRRP